MIKGGERGGGTVTSWGQMGGNAIGWDTREGSKSNKYNWKVC